MRLFFLALLLVGACLGPASLGGQEGEDLVDTATDDDIDDDTAGTDTGGPDTDSDDTDVDTADSGTDSVDTRFTGPFDIAVIHAEGAETCTGTITLTLEGTALNGTASCTFDNALAESFPAGLEAIVQGDVGTDATAGTLTFVTGVVGELAWTGITTELAVTGTFDGTLGDESPLAMNGRFDAAQE